MASKSGLTKAQENALSYLFERGERTFKMFYEGSDVKPYRKLLELGYATTRREKNDYKRGYDMFSLTPLGERLARDLFGSNEPDPTPSADHSLLRDMPAGDVVITMDSSKYDDDTRAAVYKKMRSFYREAVGNLYDFHEEFGTDEYGLSDDAIDEWYQMDADDEYLSSKSHPADDVSALRQGRDYSEPAAQEAQDTVSETVTCYNVFGEPYTITVTEPTADQIDRFNRAMGEVASTTNNRMNTEGYTDTFYNRMDSDGREAFLATLGYPEIVTIMDVQFERRENGTLQQLPATVDASLVAKVAAHDAYVDAMYPDAIQLTKRSKAVKVDSVYPAPLTADEKREIVASSEPQTGVQWRKRDYFLDPDNFPEHRYWVQSTVWFDMWVLGFYSVESISRRNMRQKSPYKARSAISAGVQVRRQPNMQKRLKSKPTRKIKPIQKPMQTVNEVLENAA